MTAAHDVPLVVAALYERKVYVWDTDLLTVVRSFDTVLDFGGCRVAVSLKGELLYVASAEKQELQCWKMANGELLWSKRKLGCITRLDTLLYSGQLACEVYPATCLVHDAERGKLLERHSDVKRLTEDPLIGSRFFESTPHRVTKIDGTAFSIPKETFGVLAAVFGDRVLALSESTGHVRCFSTDDGTERWRYEPPLQHHVLDLEYLPAYGKFYGIEWQYTRGEGGKTLLQIDETTGHCERIRSFESLVCNAVSRYDNLMYTHDGSAIDVRTGEVVKRLPFEEYIGVNQ